MSSFRSHFGYVSISGSYGDLHFLHPEDVQRAIENGCVVDHDDAAIRTRLDVQTAALAVFVILTTELVTYSLNRHAEIFSDAMNGTIRQTVLD